MNNFDECAKQKKKDLFIEGFSKTKEDDKSRFEIIHKIKKKIVIKFNENFSQTIYAATLNTYHGFFLSISVWIAILQIKTKCHDVNNSMLYEKEIWEIIFISFRFALSKVHRK